MGLFSKKDPSLVYSTSYAGFWIKVYKNRVEFKNSAGTRNIPISQISGVSLAMMGVLSITIETTGGEKHKIPTRKKKAVKEAIYEALSMGSENSLSERVSSTDELGKLFDLKEKGAITEEEFETEKKKLLANS
jgi:hypothetical protein